MAASKLPPALAAGVDAPSYIPEFNLEGDWVLDGDRWMVPCRLCSAASSELVPSPSWWHLAVDSAYPSGSVRFFPAERGIQVTFPHQRANDPERKKAYRSGDPCLSHENRALGRFGGDPEPSGAHERLAWHVQRLQEWVEFAAAGQLLRAGDYFEHPDAREQPGFRLAYLEDHQSLDFWAGCLGEYGQVEFRGSAGPSLTLYPTEFRGNDFSFRPAWGKHVEQRRKPLTGAWVLASGMPLIKPWGYPRTWGELESALAEQGIALYSTLEKHAEALRDGGPHPLLLGYPIPERMGGPPKRIHWQGILMPELSRKSQTFKGFRPGPVGRWMRDRLQVLGKNSDLYVLQSVNFHPDELGSRGLLPPELRSMRFLVVGAGALGSAVAEHLARTGVQHITIVDGDSLEPGNLVRHTLTLADLGRPKAEALAQRLNDLSPHVRAAGHARTFVARAADIQTVARATDVFLDTTGNDAVLEELRLLSLAKPATFFSLSVGWEGKTLYAFGQRGRRFDLELFRKTVDPHVRRDMPQNLEDAMPREGIGCWHPVFPALYTDIQLMASIGARFIREFVEGGAEQSTAVYEQNKSAEGWAGVSRRAS